MHVFLALPYYLAWHYTTAFSDMMNIWKNFFSFLYEFFSIPLLIRTLFSPWRRMKEDYGRIEDFFGNLVVNTMMRLVGAVIRIIFILMGLTSLLFCALVGVALFVFWVALPFLLIYSLLEGIYLFTK
ncbi:MAG: hypothetical protein WAW92_02215 [Minisyncoccia bacterium]